MKKSFLRYFFAVVVALSLMSMTMEANAYCRWNGYGHRVCWHTTYYHHYYHHCGWRHGHRVCWY